MQHHPVYRGKLFATLTPARQVSLRWAFGRVLGTRRPLHSLVRSRTDCRASHSPSEGFRHDIMDDGVPDFDDLVLDDELYKEMGEDREVLEKYPPWAPEATDPKGYNVSFEQYLENRKDIPDYIKKDLRDAQYFGPPVLLLAGFRLEELPIMRVMVDKILGEDVKVIPVFGTEILQTAVEEALELPEPDWKEPRPEHWTRGGTWGSQRTIVFGGLPMESQAAIVEVIEESGLPPVCCTIASEETRSMPLGELMADAIKIQRDRKNPEKNVWETDGKMVDDISDLKEFYTSKLTERLRTVRDGLESGQAELEEDEEQGVLKVKMEGMREEIFDAEEISHPVKKPQPKRETPSAPKTAPPRTASSTPSSSDKQTRKKTQSKRAVMEWNEERDALLKEEEEEMSDSGQNEEFDLSDFFAVDDLVFEELGMEKPERHKKQPPTIPPPYKPPEATDQNTKATGNVYPISTGPETVEPGVKRSTVFSGLVDDADKFMKDNFGYDLKKGGITPTQEEMETMKVDVTTLAEQEALPLYGEPSMEDTAPSMEDTAPSMEDTAPSMEDIVQSALEKGVDPAQLQRFIDSFPTSGDANPKEQPSNRPRFSRRRRSR